MENELIEPATPVATKKKLVRVKPYTRVENHLPALAEGVELPEGYVPAYYRKRKSLIVLRATDRSHYVVFDANTGDKKKVSTCADASALMSAIRRGVEALV
jgi:hypothetical protein